MEDLRYTLLHKLISETDEYIIVSNSTAAKCDSSSQFLSSLMISE